MEMLSIVLTLIQMCWNIMVFLKLHIIFIPLAFINLCEIGGAFATTIISASIILWLVALVKAILSIFK